MAAAMEKTNPTRVIVVDDDRTFRQNLGMALNSNPHFCCLGGYADALGDFSPPNIKYPHVAVVDIFLPRLNGLYCLWHLRRRFPGCRVVILSKHICEEYRLVAARLGAVEFLRKPLAISRLITILGELAKGSHVVDGDTGNQSRACGVSVNHFPKDIWQILGSSNMGHCLEMIHPAIARAAHYKVSELADMLLVSRRQLERQFERILWVAPRTWLERFRVLEGQRLKAEGLKGKELAPRLGFDHANNYFSWSKHSLPSSPRGLDPKPRPFL
jgi:DNA-binding NarL/FixJ family response regulator